MPDEIIITPASESTSADPTQENQSANIRSQLTSLCAAGLGISFFLPWARVIFGATISGFDLQKDGGGQLLLWLIPLFSIITIATGFANAGQHIVARLTGVLPFIVGIYWLNRIGSDLFHILTFGAYLSLIFGAAMLILPQKTK